MNGTRNLPLTLTDMDERGHFPVHPCKGCGRELCGADGPRPAETYAGTYTGLCYGCTREGPYVVNQLPDGSVRLSYPPHCPSYRRDREEFWAHPSCAECKGSGRHRVSRSDALGGPYYTYCKSCVERVARPYRANELALLCEVRRLLAQSAVSGDPIAACRTAALEANQQARGQFATEPQAYRPDEKLALRVIAHGIGKRQLGAKRARTLLASLLKALDAEIERRIVAAGESTAMTEPTG